MSDVARTRLPGWPPFAVLASTAAYLALRWDAMPERWIIHWDASGRPNGWARHDVAGVYGILILAAVVLVVLEGSTALAAMRPADGARQAMRAASRDCVRAMAIGVSVVMSLLAVTLPLGPHLSPLALTAGCLLPLVVALSYGVTRLVGAARDMMRARSRPSGGLPAGYHALYYSNASDPRLWVPKLSGMGLTINFAHRWAWPVMLLIVAAPVAIAVVTSVAAH